MKTESTPIPILIYRLLDEGYDRDRIAHELVRREKNTMIRDLRLAPIPDEELAAVRDQWERYKPRGDQMREVVIRLPDHELEALGAIMERKKERTLEGYLTRTAHKAYMQGTTTDQRERGYEARRLAPVYYQAVDGASLLHYRRDGEEAFLRSSYLLTPYDYNEELATECLQEDRRVLDATLAAELKRMEPISAEAYNAVLQGDEGAEEQQVTIVADLNLDDMTFSYAYPGEEMHTFDLHWSVATAERVILEGQYSRDRNRIFLEYMNEVEQRLAPTTLEEGASQQL